MKKTKKMAVMGIMIGLMAITAACNTSDKNITDNKAETNDVQSEASTDELNNETDADNEKNEKALSENVKESDILTQQLKTDEALKKELQNGYTFENPLVVVNPYGNSPLTAMVIFNTEENLAVDAIIKGKSEENNINVSFEKDTKHVLPIYGLYLNDTTQVELTLENGQKTVLEIKTDNIETALTNVEITADNKTFLDTTQFTFGVVLSADGGSYSSVAYDNAGDIRWLLVGGEKLRYYTQASNGRLLTESDELIKPYYYMSGIWEMDMCGKIYNIYNIPGGVHHDFIELSNGNLLVCGNRSDFSTIEDYIVEIDRKTGEVVYELDLMDIFDYKDGGSINRTDEDWFHNNSIDYIEDKDLIILSGRHVDAVVAIEKSTKELKWILGDPSGFNNIDKSKFFTPIDEDGTFEWQYAQHQAVVIDDDKLVMFDNGAGRTKAGREDKAVSGDDVYSRTVCYQINTQDMTIKQVSSYGKERKGEWYSAYVSGVQCLGEDNFWVTSGANKYDTEKNTFDVPYDQMGNNLEKSAYFGQVVNEELVYEIKFNGLMYRTFRMNIYPSNYSFNLDEAGKYHGDLGISEGIQTDVDISKAVEADFEIKAMTKYENRFEISGSWEETADDAALILADENGMGMEYKISKPLFDMGNDKVSFSRWVSKKGLEGVTYNIYIRNNGILYNTNEYVTF